MTTAILDRLEMNDRTAEQRALLQRDAQLSVSAITSGSLACLDGVAGEQVENACEQAVFADAQSTAKAVAYVGARLSLLADVAVTARGDRDFLAAFATGAAPLNSIAMGSPLMSSLCATDAPQSAVQPWPCLRIPERSRQI